MQQEQTPNQGAVQGPAPDIPHEDGCSSCSEAETAGSQPEQRFGCQENTAAAQPGPLMEQPHAAYQTPGLDPYQGAPMAQPDPRYGGAPTTPVGAFQPAQPQTQPVQPQGQPAQSQAWPAQPQARPDSFQTQPVQPQARPTSFQTGPVQPQGQPTPEQTWVWGGMAASQQAQPQSWVAPRPQAAWPPQAAPGQAVAPPQRPMPQQAMPTPVMPPRAMWAPGPMPQQPLGGPFPWPTPGPAMPAQPMGQPMSGPVSYMPSPGQPGGHSDPKHLYPPQAEPGQENRYGELYGLIRQAADGNPDVSKFLNFFQTTRSDFWKGAAIGAGLTLLLTNDAVKGVIAGGVASVMGFLGGQSAEDKEAEEDRKAEERAAREATE